MNKNKLLALLTMMLALVYMNNSFADSFKVNQTITSGRIEWTSAFNVNVLPHEIAININISLIATKGVSSSILESKRLLWREAIDKVWNNRFYTSLDSINLPININVNFTHHHPHHRVLIYPDTLAPNQHNWHLTLAAPVVAHEIGHMLGAYDEYRGGAVSTKNPIIDNTSIMGGSSKIGVAYPRHLELLAQGLSNQFGSMRIRIRKP